MKKTFFAFWAVLSIFPCGEILANFEIRNLNGQDFPSEMKDNGGEQEVVLFTSLFRTKYDETNHRYLSSIGLTMSDYRGVYVSIGIHINIQDWLSLKSKAHGSDSTVITKRMLKSLARRVEVKIIDRGVQEGIQWLRPFESGRKPFLSVKFTSTFLELGRELIAKDSRQLDSWSRVERLNGVTRWQNRFFGSWFQFASLLESLRSVRNDLCDGASNFAKCTADFMGSGLSYVLSGAKHTGRSALKGLKFVFFGSVALAFYAGVPVALFYAGKWVLLPLFAFLLSLWPEWHSQPEVRYVPVVEYRDSQDVERSTWGVKGTESRGILTGLIEHLTSAADQTDPVSAAPLREAAETAQKMLSEVDQSKDLDQSTMGSLKEVYEGLKSLGDLFESAKQNPLQEKDAREIERIKIELEEILNSPAGPMGSFRPGWDQMQLANTQVAGHCDSIFK